MTDKEYVLSDLEDTIFSKDFIYTERNRIHPLEVKSEFEDGIFSEIMIWGYSENIKRIENAQPVIKYPSIKELAVAYWDTILPKNDLPFEVIL